MNILRAGICVIPAYIKTDVFISGETWLIMLYQDADGYTLEEDIVLDFNEAEYADSSDKVRVGGSDTNMCIVH